MEGLQERSPWRTAEGLVLLGCSRVVGRGSKWTERKPLRFSGIDVDWGNLLVPCLVPCSSQKWSVQLPSPSEAKPHHGLPPHSHSMTWAGIPVGLWASHPPSLWCHDLFPGFSAVPGGSQPPPLPTPFLGELPCKEKAKGGSFRECRVGLEKGWSHDK